MDTDFGEIKSTTSRNFWQLDPSLLDLTFADSQLAGLSQFRPDLDSTSKIFEERENMWEELKVSGGDIEEFSWLFGISLGQEDVTGTATRTVPMPSDEILLILQGMLITTLRLFIPLITKILLCMQKSQTQLEKILITKLV